MYSKYVDPKDTITHIYKEISYLNPALRRIGEYILDNPEKCKTITIKELAAACKVAESTVTRFVKEMGFNSYQQLKIGITEAMSMNDSSNNIDNENYVYEHISRNDSIDVIIDKVVYRNMEKITETKKVLNTNEILKAVKIIEKAKTLMFCCIGSSCIAGEEGVMRFTRSGKKCVLYRDESTQLMNSSITNSDDVVIGISNSGKSLSIIKSLELAKANGASTICITSEEDSPIIKYSDVKLYTPTKLMGSGSGIYWESTTSKIAQILVIDVLYACFATNNFDNTVKCLEKTYNAIKDTRISEL